jgi:flagellar hook-associated protein 3 FlgL
MRISTGQFYGTQASDYQRNFANAVKSTASEASSLQRVNTAADDPLGAGRLLQLGQQASMLDQYSAPTSPPSRARLARPKRS